MFLLIAVVLEMSCQGEEREDEKLDKLYQKLIKTRKKFLMNWVLIKLP